MVLTEVYGFEIAETVVAAWDGSNDCKCEMRS